MNFGSRFGNRDTTPDLTEIPLGLLAVSVNAKGPGNASHRGLRINELPDDQVFDAS